MTIYTTSQAERVAAEAVAREYELHEPGSPSIRVEPGDFLCVDGDEILGCRVLADVHSRLQDKLGGAL